MFSLESMACVNISANMWFIRQLHNDDCLTELERSSPRRLSSQRRLSPLCPRTQPADRIYAPHDLCLASAVHIKLWIVCLCFVRFPQTVNHVYCRTHRCLFVLCINILPCMNTWLVSVWYSFEFILKDLFPKEKLLSDHWTKTCTEENTKPVNKQLMSGQWNTMQPSSTWIECTTL